MKQFFTFGMFLYLVTFASVSQGIENEKDERYFYDSCQVFLEDPAAAGAVSCSDYIHGFLEGARMVESLFIDHLESDHNSLSGFSERAYRTRVGQPEGSDLDSPSAPFCLPESEFNADIMLRLMSKLPRTVGSLQEMDNLFFKALTEDYPCRS